MLITSAYIYEILIILFISFMPLQKLLFFSFPLLVYWFPSSHPWLCMCFYFIFSFFSLYSFISLSIPKKSFYFSFIFTLYPLSFIMNFFFIPSNHDSCLTQLFLFLYHFSFLSSVFNLLWNRGWETMMNKGLKNWFTFPTYYSVLPYPILPSFSSLLSLSSFSSKMTFLRLLISATCRSRNLKWE